MQDMAIGIHDVSITLDSSISNCYDTLCSFEVKDSLSMYLMRV